jgi:hypothetical protein
MSVKPTSASPTAATITPIAAKRSRAARAADQNALSATVTVTTKAPAKQRVTKTVPPKAAAPKPERTGPTNAEKRIAANALCKAAADMLAKWNPKAHEGVTAEVAAAVIASGLNYLPVSEWDSRLPERSGAGGRGGKTRKTA